MKTEPHARHHHEGEPPPESLIHHEEPTLLEQWFRRGLEAGPAFWGAMALARSRPSSAWRIWPATLGDARCRLAGRLDRAGRRRHRPRPRRWPFGPDPNAELPDRLREIAQRPPRHRRRPLGQTSGPPPCCSTRVRPPWRPPAARRPPARSSRPTSCSPRILESAEDDSLRRHGRPRPRPGRRGPPGPRRRRPRPRQARRRAPPSTTRVVEDYPDTPEGSQAAALKRRLAEARASPSTSNSPAIDADASHPLCPVDAPASTSAPAPPRRCNDMLGLPPARPSTGSSLPGRLAARPRPRPAGRRLDPPASLARRRPDIPAPAVDDEMPVPGDRSPAAPAPGEAEMEVDVEVQPAPAEPGTGTPEPAPARADGRVAPRARQPLRQAPPPRPPRPRPAELPADPFGSSNTGRS